MMRSSIRGLSAALLCLAVVGASRPVGSQLALKAESQLWFDGKSTIRDWSCKATAIEGKLEAPSATPVADVLAAKKAVRTATLNFPTAKLDCDNGTMNKHMRNALNADTHKSITFTLTDYELSAAKPVSGTLRGTLAINGVTQPITLAAQFAGEADGTLRVTGSHDLNMTEWSVEPPKLMLGTLKVKETVTVRFDLLLQP